MKYPTVKLKEVGEFINGRAFKPSEWKQKGLPIIRIQNLTNTSQAYNYYDGPIENKYIIQDDDLLISWSASLGIYIWKGGKAVLNQHTFKVKLHNNIDKMYFYYAMKNILIVMESQVHGATMKHITKGRFDGLNILYPPLPTQRKIAAILEKAEAAMQKRKEANELTDEFLRSVFLDMFGDPLRQTNNRKKLSDVCIINPKIGVKLKKGSFVSFVPMRSVSEEGYIDIGITKTYEEVSKGYTYFKNGDVLFAKITPCMENGKGAIAQNLKNGVGFGSTEFHVLRPLKQLTSEWLHFVLSYKPVRDIAARNMTGTAGQKRVPTSFLSNVVISIPNIEDQKIFSNIYIKVKQLKNKQKASEQELNNLFNSLMQRAFSGELA
jgi:type I restriction enzyme S subunit